MYAVILCAALTAPACFVRKRTIASPPGQTAANRILLSATKDQLIARIHDAFDPIQDFTMRADMSPSVGSVYTGSLTDYATIRAYVLFLRPDNIRVIGLDPVVHSTTIFDMVSTGPDFRVLIPSKSAFIEGNNNAPPSSRNKLENLRPEAFLRSLIVSAPEPADMTVLEDDTDETKAVYIVLILREEQGKLVLARSVFFDRHTLQLSRQKTFNADGIIVSETRYSDWRAFGSVSYPSVIQIRRPLDGYEVIIDVLELKADTPDVTHEKFMLEQPPGTHVTVLK